MIHLMWMLMLIILILAQLPMQLMADHHDDANVIYI